MQAMHEANVSAAEKKADFGAVEVLQKGLCIIFR